jgi:hypothetical protein
MLSPWATSVKAGVSASSDADFHRDEPLLEAVCEVMPVHV